jgi:hypothetical protein
MGGLSLTSGLSFQSYIVAQSAVAGTTYTGGTGEIVLQTVRIPPMLPNDSLLVLAKFSHPGGSGNNKSLRVRFGAVGAGTGGTQIYVTTQTTNLSSVILVTINNRGTTASQLGSNNVSGGVGSAGAALSTAAIETSVGSDVILTGSLANGSDSITLEFYSVILLRQ